MKSTCLITSILLIQSACLAQAIRTVGVKVGAVSASQDWHYASTTNLDTERRWGLDVGVFVEWLNLPAFSISSEMHYVQKGMKETVPITTEQNPDGTGEYLTFSPRVDYLSFPLLAKVRFADGVLSPYIEAGPRVDFLLHTRGDGFEFVLDRFEHIDFGGTVGLGLEIRSLEAVQLGIEFRYSPSLTHGYSSQFLDVRNNSLEFLLVAGF